MQAQPHVLKLELHYESHFRVGARKAQFQEPRMQTEVNYREPPRRVQTNFWELELRGEVYYRDLVWRV